MLRFPAKAGGANGNVRKSDGRVGLKLKVGARAMGLGNVHVGQLKPIGWVRPPGEGGEVNMLCNS